MVEHSLLPRTFESGEVMMETISTLSQANWSEHTTTTGTNGPRPSRRGRSRNTASIPHQSHNPAVASTSTTGNGQNSMLESSRPPTSPRGRGRGRRADPRRTVNGRLFGGQLTQQEPTDSTQASSQSRLQATAPTFVPGQAPISAHSRKTHLRQREKHHPKPRVPKSQAEDIATRTHEDIDHGHYECPICTSEVQRNSKVWSCRDCWTVFHLTCIKKWASNEGSSAARQEAEDGTLSSRQWRCPGCNLPKQVMPKNYACWCGKEDEPRPLAGLPPHSCGNSCGRDRRCPHPCQLTCHAGPCPVCPYNGPTQICFCGKHESTKRCAETNYDSGWSCGEICGQAMSCGDHTCSRPCHSGPCEPCDVRLPVRCYCGRVEKDTYCRDRGETKKSYRNAAASDVDGIGEEWDGNFSCNSACGRPFDCGIHRCTKTCHPQDAQTAHCPNSPDVVTHCPCYKTSLTTLNVERSACTDPIPHCDKVCARIRTCGHPDNQICHPGECGPCMERMDIKCRCGRITSRTVCHQGNEAQPQCARVCKTTLNCGRHACDERCCTGERKALERLSSKRKHRPLHSGPTRVDEDVEAEHICTRQCGKLLKCNTHHCQDLCHKGPCNSCREAIFEEISCSCGRTVLDPPLPCGTKPPPCNFPCTRIKTCGHPQVAHTCHSDDDSCPKCPFLIEKRCTCGKKTLKNQQCWLQDVRCGEICARKLKCGAHFCRKTCHRPGDCEGANGAACTQLCGKEKKCGHPDLESTCHAPFACKEDTSCQSKIFITCACQAQKQEVKCNVSSKNSTGNADRTLPCNDECARLERNRKLALALDIDQATHVDGGDHIPYSTETLNLFAAHTAWAQNQEREFRVFAASQDEKRMRFKPMQGQQRAFIHALAEDFGLDSESMDPEPHRHVMIWKTPRFVSAPNKTLAEAMRLRVKKPTAVALPAPEPPAKSKPINSEPFNALILHNPPFGLIIDDLEAVIHPLTPPRMQLNIIFLPSNEVILKSSWRVDSSDSLQPDLGLLRERLESSSLLSGKSSLKLCTVNDSNTVVRREDDTTNAQSGWSKVAAKRSVPQTTLAPISGLSASNTFAALGTSKVTFSKKKPALAAKKEAVVDDWEAAELAEELKEDLVLKERLTDGEDETALGEDVGHETEPVDGGVELGSHAK